ncbi:MAG: hypothetical protein ABR981_02355 [Candidatus Micrarchaeaceae archaeon]|jgi:hypothetical protein
MEHIAIMKKSWKLTQKIISKEKTLEMRWYKAKYLPWNRINKEDTVYFKDSGEPVTIKSKVNKVLCFSNLTHKKVRDILNKYGKPDGLNKNQIREFSLLFKDKNYCIVIFLKNVEAVEPFHINKNGFGSMSAWITVANVGKLRI